MVVLYLAQNIEIIKFFFYKNCFIYLKIINIFVKLVHNSFIS